MTVTNHNRLIGFMLAVTAAAHLAGCAQFQHAEVQPLPAGQTEVTVPVKSGGHLLLASVQVNEMDAGWFVVDTGSPVNVVDRGVADRLKLPETWKISPYMPQKLVDSKCREVRSLTIVPLAFGEHAVAVANRSAEGSGAEGKINGILGTPVLQELPFTLDYRASTVTFHDREHFRPPAGAASFPLDFRYWKPYVKCRINDGQDEWVLLDTGAMKTVELKQGFWKRSSELAPGTLEFEDPTMTLDGMSECSLGKLASVEIFGRRFQNLPASLSKDDVVDERAIGLIGGNLLANFRLTFDYKAKKVWVEWNPEESASELVARGVDLDAEDYLGFDRLVLAFRSGQTERARELIAAGWGRAPGARGAALLLALVNDDPETAKELIEAGADVNAKSIQGDTAIMLAAGRGHGDIVQMLIARGAEVNVTDKQKHTALMFAAAMGSLSSVDALIAAGADVNASMYDGGTSLMAAAFAGHVDVVRILLRNGANVNAVDKEGVTILMSASSAGHTEVVEVLLDAGADMNARNSKGKTALDLATKHKHKDVVRILRTRNVGKQVTRR